MRYDYDARKTYDVLFKIIDQLYNIGLNVISIIIDGYIKIIGLLKK